MLWSKIKQALNYLFCFAGYIIPTGAEVDFLLELFTLNTKFDVNPILAHFLILDEG